MKKLKLGSRARLILAGAIAGSFPSAYLFILYSTITPSLKVVTGGFCTTCLIIIPLFLWFSEETIKKTTHKARLLFFGISLISFILAFADLAQYGLGSHTIKVSNIDIYIGDISFSAIQTNFAVAGFFSLLERGLDLHEKKDL